MKIMLSAIENTTAGFIPLCVEKGIKFKWNLMSYYYIKNKAKGEKSEFVRDNSEEILIDSGAHSFQFGIKTNFEQYVKDYAQFIKDFDRPNVVAFCGRQRTVLRSKTDAMRSVADAERILSHSI